MATQPPLQAAAQVKPRGKEGPRRLGRGRGRGRGRGFSVAAHAALRLRRRRQPRQRRLLRRVYGSLPEAQAPWTQPPPLPPPLAFARCGFVMATTQRPYHLVVFGASGFTGQFVTEEVAREQVDLEGNSRLPWAVAGRSAEKLQRALERAALKLGKGGGVGRGSGPPLLSPPQLSSPGRGDRATRDERFSFLAARLELHKPCWRTGKQSDASNSVLALFSVMLKIVVISFPSFDFLLYFG